MKENNMKYSRSMSSSKNDSATKIIQKIRSGSTILEFGCASGMMTRHFKQKLGCEVYIVEKEDAAFDQAITYAKNGTRGDIEDYGWLEAFKSIKFDYIIFADVLEHLYHPDKVLEASKELLKDTGAVLVSVPNIANNAIILTLFENNFTYSDTGLLDSTHIRFFAYKNLQGFCENAGFTIIEEDAVLLDYYQNEQYSNIKTINSQLISLLAQRKLGTVYQFILTLKKTETIAESMDSVNKYKLTHENGALIRIYYNTGSGYSDHETIDTIVCQNDRFEFFCHFPTAVTSLRFNPSEDSVCAIKDIKIYSDTERLELNDFNGLRDGQSYLFNNADSQMILSSPSGAVFTSVKISGYLTVTDDTTTLNTLRRLIKQTVSKLTHINYTTVTQVLFWKIKKHAKRLFDFMKKIMNVNKISTNILLLLYSLKNHGVKKTFLKVKRKLSPNNASVYNYGVASSLCEGGSQDTNIKFSIVAPLYNTPKTFLKEMIASVATQTYPNWELCIADGSDGKVASIEKIMQEFCRKDKRIKYKKLKENKGISENTNECLDMAVGDYIVLLDHDDILAPNALMENKCVIDKTLADVLYSDEDRTDGSLRHFRPFFKPDWSPDLLYTQMYICHLLVFNRKLLEKAGLFDSAFDGAQDYDMMLRLSEQTGNIFHIPHVLYSWRESAGSTALSSDSKPYAHMAGMQALNAHLKRKYGGCAYAESTPYTFVYQARFKNLTHTPLVSIIIPMKDKWELTCDCIASINSVSLYHNYEIIILDNNSTEHGTFRWFEKVTATDPRVKIINAPFEFNWAKLNNLGIEHAAGDIFIFMNNDMKIISQDWIDKLAENVLREDIGVAGAQLLYEDDSIQHAGISLGMRQWTDNVFKGMPAEHYMSPFVSPMVNRNVLAVTGACMAVSRDTIQKVGFFDEHFAIFGSDIEFCLRVYNSGYNNLYIGSVQLYHLEPKNRSEIIPEADLTRLAEVYSPYREEGDPYFNINLDTNQPTPVSRVDMSNILYSLKNQLKRYKIVRDFHQKLKSAMFTAETSIPEVKEINFRESETVGEEIRLNLLLPTVSEEHAFGGITTALEIFLQIANAMNVKSRIIITNIDFNPASSVLSECYKIRTWEQDICEDKQVVPFVDRDSKTIPVGKNDIFVATGWWTLYSVKNALEWQQKTFNSSTSADIKLIYLIQDYEPGFYQWSSRYLMAESTYRLGFDMVAIFNSSSLKNYFTNKGYSFRHELYFEPLLNPTMRSYIDKVQSHHKKRQILIYGRASIARNAFEMIIESLTQWRKIQPDANEWRIVSVGEAHQDIDIGGVVVKSVGKLSIDAYAEMLLDSYAGISLMVSPHPSYPPLEMAAFGVKTITNSFANKDLSGFSCNILSIDSCSKYTIAEKLKTVCDDFSPQATSDVPESYMQSENIFKTLGEDVRNILLKK